MKKKNELNQKEVLEEQTKPNIEKQNQTSIEDELNNLLALTAVLKAGCALLWYFSAYTYIEPMILDKKKSFEKKLEYLKFFYYNTAQEPDHTLIKEIVEKKLMSLKSKGNKEASRLYNALINDKDIKKKTKAER